MIEYETSAVARIAGVSKRQLQWWDEQAIVKPLHRKGFPGGGGGSRRFYTPEQLVEVQLVVALRRAGCLPHQNHWIPKARVMLRALRRTTAVQPIVKRVPRLYLLTDGRETYFETDYQKLLARLKKAKTGMSLVDLTELAMGTMEGKAA